MIWRLIAFVASRPAVSARLIARAWRTPYSHITSADGKSVYMGRWWLFNPYGKDAQGEPTPARWRWLPSVRVHHIRCADLDRHLHDHPWNARTIVLRGWYTEERPWNWLGDCLTLSADAIGVRAPDRAVFHRVRGYTGRLLFGQYHRISEVANDGAWTLFFTWQKRGTWGFLVGGQKVPWREYLSQHSSQEGGAA